MLNSQQAVKLNAARQELDVMAKIIEILIPLSPAQPTSVLEEVYRRVEWDRRAQRGA